MHNANLSLVIPQFATWLLGNGLTGFEQKFVEEKILHFLTVSEVETSLQDKAAAIAQMIWSRWLMAVPFEQLLAEVEKFLQSLALAAEMTATEMSSVARRPIIDRVEALKRLTVAEGDFLITMGWKLVENRSGFFRWRGPEEDQREVPHGRAVQLAQRELTSSEIRSVGEIVMANFEATKEQPQLPE